MVVFKIINIEDAPEFKYRRPRTDWKQIFKSISLGKAGIIEGDKGLALNVSHALTRQQKKGLFKNYYIRRLGNKIYIVNGVR